MTETAAPAMDGYREFVREVFIDPIRAVTVIDDEFPTLDLLLTEKLGGKGLDVPREDCERVFGILEFCRSHPRSWLVDIHDGGKQDDEVEIAGHLSQSDLLILDYQLVKGDQSGDKAIEILRKLADNDHFNLVVVYTQAASTGEHAMGRIVREIALGLTCEEPALELHQNEEAATDGEIDKWQDEVPGIEEKFREAVDQGTYLEYRKRAEPGKVSVFEDIGGIAEQLTLLADKPEGVKLRKKQLVKWALTKRQERLRSGLSPKCFGRVKFEPGPIGRNWVRTDRMFVTVVDKKTKPADIPDLLSSALSDWDPAPHRLLMSKMRSELDRRGVPVESEILDDLFLQAGWLEEFLQTDESTRRRHVRHAIRRHWEGIGDRMERDVVDYAYRLSDDILKLDRASLMSRFSPLDLDTSRRNILLHLNCHNCSKVIEGSHLSTGHVIQVGHDEYKLCLSPACDLEPGQKTGAGFHKRLADWMPFTAVSLQPACFPNALSEASAGSYLFLRSSTDSEIKVFQCVPSLSEPMFAADQGRFSADGDWKLDLARIRGSGSGLHTEAVDGVVVAQLRYEYALNLLHRLGHHLSRIGLDFKALPTGSEGIG